MDDFLRCFEDIRTRVPMHIDPEEGRDKKIVIRAPECWEAEVTVQVRRKE